ncbi:amino acid permease, partial [Rhodococcus erythropolis]|nr:amino acid permease [Rhodococcus erythropolis]
MTHWFFRKRMKEDGTKLSFTIPFFPVGTILGGVLMVAILITTLWVDDFKMTLVFGVPFVLAVIGIYYFTR